VTIALVLGPVSCGETSDGGATVPNCGLPTREPGVDDSLVPDLYLPDEALLTRAQRERGGFLAQINVELGVQDALRYYRRAVQDAGYEIIQSDNEGFEAELYLRKDEMLAAVQIRTSQCDDESIVFVNEVDAARLGGNLPSPSPKQT
jgi:hypothetical protein